jgi:quercetin dioxygenase-like cupin family protein
MSGVVVIQPDDGRTFSAFGSAACFKLEGEHTGGKLCLALAETPPNAGPPLHLHNRDDELFIVVQGELEVTADGETKRAPAGSVVFLPRGTKHTFRNSGTTLSKHWVLVAPSGFEQFYARSADVFSAGPPNPQALRDIAAEYGYEILGVPPRRDGGD